MTMRAWPPSGQLCCLPRRVALHLKTICDAGILQDSCQVCRRHGLSDDYGRGHQSGRTQAVAWPACLCLLMT